MLRSLSIRDFVIVDTLDVEFHDGFSVFTGQTGAGKSILIDALALTLGERAATEVVRQGATKVDITAEFSVNKAVQMWLDEQCIEQDHGAIFLRRVVEPTGRSKAFINGVVVTTNQLREVGEMLVDIHGQHAHQSLLKPEAQRILLDAWAGLTEKVKKISEVYKNWRTLIKQNQAWEESKQARLAEKERLTFLVDELEKINPKEGEWEAINAEHVRLSHAANLLSGVEEVYSALSESDVSINSHVFGLKQKLQKLSEVDKALIPALELLDAAYINLHEATPVLSHYLGQLELDQDRLSEVEERVQVLFSVARKFKVEPNALALEYQRLKVQLSELEEMADQVSVLEKEKEFALEYETLAQQISKERAKKAVMLSRAVTRMMQDLSMSGGSFEVVLRPCDFASYGQEQVEFLVAGHIGVDRRPLAKVASGGELARIALAISVITSKNTATPTLIFDEVDSGIGGGVAEVVGRLLKQLGQERQVLCVTHLPQVASQANCHFLVDKVDVGGSVISRIEVLNENHRIEEVARMLGGVTITDTTRQHAREMLIGVN
jgi:DNA repair protein RecN (Recombination protein N)